MVIAAPTNYDPQKNFFDTHHIEDVIDLVLSVNPDAVMVIKSTIPVGYCRSLYVKYALKFLTDPELKGKKFNLLFSPEFLRESKALYDNLYPSRIIVGYPKILPDSNLIYEPRKRFTVAHELGHFILGHNRKEVIHDNEASMEFYKSGSQETEANQFASELLIPTSVFLEYIDGEKFSPRLMHDLAGVKKK